MIRNMILPAFLLFFVGCATNPQRIETADEHEATVKVSAASSRADLELDDNTEVPSEDDGGGFWIGSNSELDEVDAVLRSDETSTVLQQELDPAPYWDVTQEPLLESTIVP